MSDNDHNKAAKSGNWTKTLRDMIEDIMQSDLPPARKSSIKSAITRAAKLAADGTLDQAADLQVLLTALARYSPAMLGLTPDSYSNQKSLVRTAFKLTGTEALTVRFVKLDPAWQAYSDTLSRKHRLALSRFMRFCTYEFYAPDEIRDGHIDRYRAFLTQAGLPPDSIKNITRGTINAWNRQGETQPHPGFQPLSPLPRKRESYWIPRDRWPPKLDDDISRFIADLVAPSLLKKSKTPKIKPSTAGNYEHCFTTILSALVQCGEPLVGITSLARLATAANAERAIEFLIERWNGKITRQVATLASRCRRAAEWSGAPATELEAFDDLLERIWDNIESRRGMTKKNKELIDRLEDQHFRDQMLVLPLTLMREAHKRDDLRCSPGLARDAVAIELLLTCSMRRENLARLRLGSSIKKIGTAKNSTWVIEIDRSEVKNDRPLRYQLPPESAALLEEYLETWRPHLWAEPNDWLFPSPTDGQPNARSLASSITLHSKRILGVPITPHQFRHVSATIFVGDDPTRIAIASEHLGHASIDTTRHFYLTSQQKSASRLYQQRLGLDRARSIERTRVKTRSRRSPVKLLKGDEL